MRTESKIAALSLALLFVGCSKRPEPTASLPDDLKRDLAAAAIPTSDLATAPTSYQRMRFVSDIERTRASVPAKRPKISQHHERMVAVRQPATQVDRIASMASTTPAPVSTPEAPSEEPSIVVVGARPAPPPSSTQASQPEEHGGGGGIGGLLGGIFSGAVIRGGRAGPDKCDPRTDGRARGTIIDRPDFGLPLPTGQVFGGSRRR
jgi:hypothetical protein